MATAGRNGLYGVPVSIEFSVSITLLTIEPRLDGGLAGQYCWTFMSYPIN